MYLKLPDIYPYDLARFTQDFPNTSPQDPWTESALADFGIFKVKTTPQPDIVFHEQYLVELPPENVNGEWVQRWSVIERSNEEKQALIDLKRMEIRAERDRRLKDECDCVNPMWWESMTDDQKTAFRNHRQSLLDIPSQPGFPLTVSWPVKP